MFPINPKIQQSTNPILRCSRSSKYQSATLRTSRLQVRVLPGVPFHAALAQLLEALRSERRGWGWNSLTRHHFAHVAQRRGSALKTRPVPVQVRPWAPTACSPMQRRPAQDGKVAGASPATRTIFWNVNRASEPGLDANECVPSGKWCESTAFRHYFG